jgi:hypothetical protein
MWNGGNLCFKFDVLEQEMIGKIKLIKWGTENLGNQEIEIHEIDIKFYSMFYDFSEFFLYPFSI